MDLEQVSAQPMLLALIPHLSCPECNVPFTWPIHPRTLIPDRTVLVCNSGGCRQYGKRWNTPKAILLPAPPV